MYKNLSVLLVLILLCSCAQHTTSINPNQNINSVLSAKGLEADVIDTELDDISGDIVQILHDNYSLDDTFVIKGDTTKGLFAILVPKMKQSGFKVLPETGSTSEKPTHYPMNYTFTVTNNNLIETADVALLRLWVGKEFQLSKAFTWTSHGLEDKTAYSVMRRPYYE